MTALGIGEVGLGGHRRHLGGEVAAGRVAHDRELGAVGPDVRGEVERTSSASRTAIRPLGRKLAGGVDQSRWYRGAITIRPLRTRCSIQAP